jgi:DNA repair exonuclease SbcCD ATPase subunit
LCDYLRVASETAAIHPLKVIRLALFVIFGWSHLKAQGVPFLEMTDEEKKAQSKQRKLDRYKRYYEANKERLLALKREYRKKNKERVLSKAREYKKTHKEALQEYQREYQALNRDKIKEKQKENRKANREKIKEVRRKYLEENRNKIRERRKKYFQTPSGIAASILATAKRRAKEKSATMNCSKKIRDWIKDWKSTEQVECYWCKGIFASKKCHADHVMPLSKGGMHCITNLVISCAKCNFQKHDKTPDVWMEELAKRKNLSPIQ